MKRSEFEESEREIYRGLATEDEQVERSLRAAERAGVTWDPEEPEVLWESADLRLLASGQWEWEEFCGSGKWVPYLHEHAWRGLSAALSELARRLLEEHEQQEALDEHNDKLGEEKEGVSRESPAWSRLSFLELQESEQVEINKELRQRLTVLEGKIAVLQGLVHVGDQALLAHLARIQELEQDLLLVQGQAAHVDEREAGDFEATRIHLDGLDERVAALEAPPRVAMHYNEWKRLVALDELWGDDGELRRKLSEARYSGPDTSGAVLGWFRQLRSELLALPEEFLFEEQAPEVELPFEGEIRLVSVPSACRQGTPSGECL